MSCNMNDLKFCFNTAKRFQCKYVAVLIEMDGFEKPELIINLNENIESKLDYYKQTYDDKLQHKKAKNVRIIGFAHGDNLKELLEEIPEF